MKAAARAASYSIPVTAGLTPESTAQQHRPAGSRIQIGSGLAERRTRFLVGNRPQCREHRASNARAPPHLPLQRRNLPQDRYRDHGRSIRIRQPGNVRKLAILARQLLLVRRLGEAREADKWGVGGDAVTLESTVARAPPRAAYQPENKRWI